VGPGARLDASEENFFEQSEVLFLILDISVGMYMQKYILLLSIVQSQPTHTLAIRNQA
jgi:hypothetical protein